MAKNIKATKPAGYVKKPGYESHHICPGGESYKSAVDARAKIESFGIDINEAINGVDLPKDFHKLTQNTNAKKYCDAIWDRIKDKKTANEVRAELAQIELDLNNKIKFW